MNSAQQQHDTKVAALAADYELQGYTVRRQVSPEGIPFGLNGYTLDFLAERGNEHLLVEVKKASTPLSMSRLRDLVENVKQQPGWRFILVATSADNEQVPLPQEPLSWQGIASRVEQAKRLHETSEPEAAILLFWSALEALLRRHAENVGLPIEHLSVRALIDYLYSEAELSFEQFETVKQLLPARNQLAHGFQMQDAGKSATQLQALLDELSSDWLQMHEVK